MTSVPLDFLLLNVSNYPSNPIFPYAFVQVSAVARKYEVQTQRFDLFGIAKDQWTKQIKQLIAQYSPRSVGITLRQVDSLIESDYLVDSVEKYLPVEDTKYLITIIRKHFTGAIVVGGFGFSAYAKLLIPYLQPDFGIQGEPDPFFEKFNSVLKRQNLADVKNLIYQDVSGEYRFNERSFIGPLQSVEYNDELADEILGFYKEAKSFCVPVEVLRGCPMRCYFCAEPDVKGTRLNYRDLGAVMADVEFLTVKRGVRQIWFVASELNVTGPELAIELAKRMIQLKEKSGMKGISWFGYLLPKISDPQIIQLLADSGHIWSWNEVQSLDEKNLKDTKVPYKVEEALGFFKAVMMEQQMSAGARAALSFFLGNAFSTPTTVVRTLKRIEDENLQGRIGRSIMITGTRVLPTREDRLPVVRGEYTRYSVNDPKVKVNSLLRPTFYLPPAIGEVTGDPIDTMRVFFALSGNFITHDLIGVKRDKLIRFLKSETSLNKFWKYLRKASHDRWCLPSQAISSLALEEVQRCLSYAQSSDMNAPAPKVLRDIFSKGRKKYLHQEIAFCLIWQLLRSGSNPKLASILEFLGFGSAPNEKLLGSFEMHRKILERYSSQSRMLNEIKTKFRVSDKSFESFAIKTLVMINNMSFKPPLRKILCAELSE